MSKRSQEAPGSFLAFRGPDRQIALRVLLDIHFKYFWPWQPMPTHYQIPFVPRLILRVLPRDVFLNWWLQFLQGYAEYEADHCVATCPNAILTLVSVVCFGLLIWCLMHNVLRWYTFLGLGGFVGKSFDNWDQSSNRYCHKLSRTTEERQITT